MSLTGPIALTSLHRVDDFNCGNVALNEWLRNRSLRNQGLGFTSVNVFSDAEDMVVAYCGLAPTAVASKSAPRSIRTGQSPDPVPCVLLGQLAVDIRHRSKGLGVRLVLDAFRRTVIASEFIGGRAMVVNAADADALRFWSRWGFTPSREDPYQLFRAMTDIRASLAAAD